MKQVRVARRGPNDYVARSNDPTEHVSGALAEGRDVAVAPEIRVTWSDEEGGQVLKAFTGDGSLRVEEDGGTIRISTARTGFGYV